MEEHERGAERLRSEGRLLAGAAAAVAALGGGDGVVQSVLTGNIEAVARHKLAAFGLDAPPLDLDIGAFADDAPTRATLVDVARTRAAAKHGRSFEGPSTVLIGDSVHDVAAALASDARIIAVATGFTPAEALQAAGAPVVLPDLTDTGSVRGAILL